MEVPEVVRRYWWAFAGGFVLLLLLLSRRQAPAPAVAAIPQELATPTPDGTLAASLARITAEQEASALRVGKAEEALALQQLESQRQLSQLQTAFQSEQLRGATVVQQKLTQKAGKVPVACAVGNAKVDPVTGALYCRQEVTKGPSIGGQSIFGQGGILSGFNQFASQVAGIFGVPLPSGSVLGGYGTPPIVPWQQGAGYPSPYLGRG